MLINTLKNIKINIIVTNIIIKNVLFRTAESGDRNILALIWNFQALAHYFAGMDEVT